MEYTKYKKIINETFVPVVLAHPNIINRYCNTKYNQLFCIDGMHRIMSYLEQNIKTIKCNVIIEKKDIYKFIELDFVNKYLYNFLYFKNLFRDNVILLKTKFNIKNIIF